MGPLYCNMAFSVAFYAGNSSIEGAVTSLPGCCSNVIPVPCEVRCQILVDVFMHTLAAFPAVIMAVFIPIAPENLRANRTLVDSEKQEMRLWLGAFTDNYFGQ